MNDLCCSACVTRYESPLLCLQTADFYIYDSDADAVTTTTVAADVTSQASSLSDSEEVKVTTESQVEKQTSRAGKQQESIETQ